MLFDYYSNILQSSHIREKLIPRLLTKNVHPLDFTFKEIRIIFLLKNNFENRNLFYALTIVLEKLTGTKFSFLSSKSTVVGFSMKKSTIFGASYILTGNTKDQFLRLFIDYSLKKLNSYSFVHHNDQKRFSLIFKDEQVKLGLEQVLFNAPITLSRRDYDLFLPIFERVTSGIYIQFYSNFRNFYINRLILSHYGLVIK